MCVPENREVTRILEKVPRKFRRMGGSLANHNHIFRIVYYSLGSQNGRVSESWRFEEIWRIENPLFSKFEKYWFLRSWFLRQFFRGVARILEVLSQSQSHIPLCILFIRITKRQGVRKFEIWRDFEDWKSTFSKNMKNIDFWDLDFWDFWIEGWDFGGS